MARYIDADALISEIEKTIKVNESPHYEMRYWKDGMTCAIDIIENAPTADVVEVVRCKDCFYRRIVNDGITHYYWCDTIQNSVNDDDYCSYGERREDE